MDKKTNTININLGNIGKSETKREFPSKPAGGLQSMAFNPSVLQPRNFSTYMLQDRYSIILTDFNIQGKCSLGVHSYNMFETGFENVRYVYVTIKTTDKIEQNVDAFRKLLFIIASYKNPPFLSLLHKQLDTFTIEKLQSQVPSLHHLSPKNSSDIKFQILAMLLCIYKHKYLIEKFTISHVNLQSPVTIEFKIGNIVFTLKDVMLIPVFSMNMSTTVKSGVSDSNMCDSYNSIASLMLCPLYDNFFPIVEECVVQCLFAHLIFEFETHSNLCSFDKLKDRQTNKYANKYCLSSSDDIGRVYSKVDSDLFVSLDNKMYLDVKNGHIESITNIEYEELFIVKDNLKMANKNISQVFTFMI